MHTSNTTPTAGSPQDAKVQPWKSAWPPVSPESRSARPKTLTSADGVALVDIFGITLSIGNDFGSRSGHPSESAEYSDLLADAKDGRDD